MEGRLWPCNVYYGEQGRKDMSAKILQINYKLNGPKAEYERENLPYAQPIADIPGLCWKVWIINEAQSEAGGIYLFDDDAAVQAFLDGPIIAEMRGDRKSTRLNSSHLGIS